LRARAADALAVLKLAAEEVRWDDLGDAGRSI